MATAAVTTAQTGCGKPKATKSTSRSTKADLVSRVARSLKNGRYAIEYIAAEIANGGVVPNINLILLLEKNAKGRTGRVRYESGILEGLDMLMGKKKE